MHIKSRSYHPCLIEIYCVNMRFHVCLHCSSVCEEGPEIFLSPAVTYGPPGLDLSCPIAMTIAHCAEVAADNWSIRLKRQVQDNKWEVSQHWSTIFTHANFYDIAAKWSKMKALKLSLMKTRVCAELISGLPARIHHSAKTPASQASHLPIMLRI